MEVEEYEKMYNLEDSYWWFVGKRRIAQNLIEEFVPLNRRAAVLDVGCGTGATMCFLDHYGRAYGIDISETALCFCQQRALSGLSRASALGLPFADNSFSLITAFDVLYHEEIVDDLMALREFREPFTLKDLIAFIFMFPYWLVLLFVHSLSNVEWWKKRGSSWWEK